jgi:hypothetical protein
MAHSEAPREASTVARRLMAITITITITTEVRPAAIPRWVTRREVSVILGSS